jgi:glucose-1-phosphate adenylyltransferase
MCSENELEKDAQKSLSQHDFGKNIIPQMIESKEKVYAYDYMEHGKPNTYWRDIGTRDAYYQANIDLVSGAPAFDLFDKNWPLRTHHSQHPPVNVQAAADKKGVVQGEAIDSLLSPGCRIQGGRVERSVLSPLVTVQKNARVSYSVIMDGVVIGEGRRLKTRLLINRMLFHRVRKLD